MTEQSDAGALYHRVCAAVVRDDTILMLHYRSGERDHWTLPGGGIEPGETPEQAVVRELQEETCVQGTVVRPLYTLRSRTQWLDAIEHCYLVAVTAEQAPAVGLDPEEPERGIFAEVAWRPLAEVGDDIQVSRVLAVLRRIGSAPGAGA